MLVSEIGPANKTTRCSGLSDFHSFTMNEDKCQNLSISRFLLRLKLKLIKKLKLKLVSLKISPKVWLCDIGQSLKIAKTLYSVPFIKKPIVNHAYNLI